MFLRQLDRAEVPAAVRAAYRSAAPFALRPPPPDPTAPPDSAGDQYLAVMSGRVPDGLLLYAAFARSLRPPGGAAPGLPPEPAVPQAEQQKVLQAGQAYLRWYEGRFGAPGAGSPSSWVAERMEYAFALSAKVSDGSVALSAAEYPGGSLDWYSFDADIGRSVNPTEVPRPQIVTRTVMPGRVRYPGMAADRWWQFEDARVNLDKVEGDADDVLRMLLVEFALLYANDWFVVPFDATFGAIYQLESLVVTDAFGERTLVPPVNRTQDAKPDWRMFTLSPTDGFLFLPPVLASSLQGEPIEEVTFFRDQPANLVWAVEHRTPSLAGGSIDRRRAPQPGSAAAGESPEAWVYQLATVIPGHWIPFVPTRIDPDRPDVRLHRAAGLVDGAAAPALSRPTAGSSNLSSPISRCSRRRCPRAACGWSASTNTHAGSTARPCSGSPAAREPVAATRPADCATTSSARSDHEA